MKIFVVLLVSLILFQCSVNDNRLPASARITLPDKYFVFDDSSKSFKKEIEALQKKIDEKKKPKRKPKKELKAFNYAAIGYFVYPWKGSNTFAILPEGDRPYVVGEVGKETIILVGDTLTTLPLFDLVGKKVLAQIRVKYDANGDPIASAIFLFNPTEEIPFLKCKEVWVSVLDH